ENILGYATASRFRQGDNPARWRGHLKTLLGGGSKNVDHHAALPFLEAPVQVLPSISSHFAPSTSLVRVAVRINNSNARADVDFRSRSSAIKAGASRKARAA